MKRVLRIVAYVLLLLLLLFLTLGLFFPTVDYTTSVVVDQPIEKSFDLYNDVDQIQEWIPELVSMKELKTTPEKIGSEYRMVVVSGGQETEMLETTTEYIENEKVGLHFDAAMMEKEDVYTFTSVGPKTKIEGKHSVKGKSYYIRCVFALFKGPFRTIDQGYLNNFKSWAEEQ